MKAFGHRMMPVVDADGKAVGLHLIDSMIGGATLPNIAVVMAGGKGTRLRPITEHIPKPMVKVAGRPILEHIVCHLADAGISKIYLAVNYLGETIEAHFGNGSDFGIEIKYIREEKPLGTAGALSLLPERPSDPILVMNGDLVTQFDVQQMIGNHEAGGYAMTVGVRDYRVDIPYGVVDWNETKKRVDGISEKPMRTYLVNAGVYLINPELLEFIEKDTNTPITDLLESSIGKGLSVGIHLLEGDWIDVGQHAQLNEARNGTSSLQI
jgi:NDP-sugar pyrophosphorylase family protein